MSYTHGKNILRSSFDGCFDLNVSTIHDFQQGIGMDKACKSDSDESFQDDWLQVIGRKNENSQNIKNIYIM